MIRFALTKRLHSSAGEMLFSVEEDVYNPARDATRVVAAWVAAGGKLESALLDIPHR